ncbi:MAG: acylneuraminate cytidylyltransferase [Bacillota bacterium]|jgi:CMP-N,N'-diacetyllegionaminic acid synthase|nr:acylneuraminate cytidylyltransferase [Bacillota bacterium]
MRNLAVIPARSGSKGLKDKNIKKLDGKPLLAYSIEVAQKTQLFDDIFVSTDSIEYARIAEEWGASVPFLRGPTLATDTASSWDVLREAVTRYQNCNKTFDTVALLQPTSPLRTAQDIQEGYRILVEKDAEAVVAVCEVDHSPLWCNILPPDACLGGFLSPDVLVPRQKLPVHYRVNGALYIVRTDFLMKSDNLYGDKSFATIMAKDHSVDIDDEMDFKLAEVLIAETKGGKTL